jgi:UDP-3-O-[3-hydroxymyristoyl] N-acetylglucosamine deacetylase/3-hydroxyacyl-[acyl-carrier-protein] dehydratase
LNYQVLALHTGAFTTMTFLPADINHGIKFQRVDMPGQPIVDADVDYVVDLSRGTTIEHNGARINTVEHTMAALVGTEVDNVLIQLNGPEPPHYGWKFRAFLLKRLKRLVLRNKMHFETFLTSQRPSAIKDEDRNVEIAALPLDDYRLTVMVDYNSPVLGSQHASLTDIRDFGKEIASCRTFCFSS